MNSIWLQIVRLPAFDCLRSDLKTNMLIIGGSMARLLCAYKQAQAGMDYSLRTVSAAASLGTHRENYRLARADSR